MKLRTSAAAAALALAAALTLTACADDSSGDGATPSASASSSPATGAPQPTKEDVAAVDAVKVEGEAGKEPKLSFTSPLEVSAPTSRVVDEGDGAELTDKMFVTMEVVTYGGDGKKVQQSTWEAGTPQSFILGDPNFGLLTEPLTGHKVGSRVLLANSQAAQDGSTQTAVNLIEVTEASELPPHAEGKAVTPEKGLPTVTTDDSGKPSVKIPDGYEAPKDLVAQPLVKGDGAKVKAGQSVAVQYSGWTLDGEQFDSSWERDMPFAFSTMGGVIQGWIDGVQGQTIGSQVLLVIPADQAYGAEKNEQNPLAGQPLVFVVDILDAR